MGSPGVNIKRGAVPATGAAGAAITVNLPFTQRQTN